MSQYGFKLKLKFTIHMTGREMCYLKCPMCKGIKHKLTIHYIARVTMRDITNKGNLK